jgi:hypothetical protein
MEYVKLFRVLQQYKVKYLVCGGLAVNIYGIPRMTADIDLLLDFDERNIVNFESALKLLLYKNIVPLPLKNLVDPSERRKLVNEKNLIAYSFFNSQAGYMNLDVLLDVPLQFDALWKNKTIKTANDTNINLVSVADLIELKNYANRRQDQEDVLLLSKLLK